MEEITKTTVDYGCGKTAQVEGVFSCGMTIIYIDGVEVKKVEGRLRIWELQTQGVRWLRG